MALCNDTDYWNMTAIVLWLCDIIITKADYSNVQ